MEGDNSNTTGTTLNVNEENSNTGAEGSLVDKPTIPDTTVETVDIPLTPIPGNIEDPKSDGKLDWPTIGDLNTRLRRVITAYQKNFRKEEIRQLQKARVS